MTMTVLLQRRISGHGGRSRSIAKRWPRVKERPEISVDWASLIAEIALRRDREAYRRLFEFFAPRIKGYLMRTGSGEAEAEEIAQETMIALWRKADKFDPATFGAVAWIYTIARNLRIDAVRRGRRAERMLQEIEAEYRPEPVESTETAFSRTQEAGHVELALQSLPAQQSEIIRLSFLEEKPHSEIAELLDIPLGTVKSRVRLAMDRLRELLDVMK
jgi:RNA polymerase sigma factor (sigma-70 family)